MQPFPFHRIWKWQSVWKTMSTHNNKQLKKKLCKMCPVLKPKHFAPSNLALKTNRGSGLASLFITWLPILCHHCVHRRGPDDVNSPVGSNNKRLDQQPRTNPFIPYDQKTLTSQLHFRALFTHSQSHKSFKSIYTHLPPVLVHKTSLIGTNTASPDL